MRQIIGAAALVALVCAAAPATARDYPDCLQGRDYGYPGLCQFTSYAAMRSHGVRNFCRIAT